MAQESMRGGGEEADELFGAWLARRKPGSTNAAPPDDFDALCAQHAEHAPRLRKLHDDWQYFTGLMDRLGLSVSAPHANAASPDEPSAVPPSLAQRIRARFGPGVDPNISLEPEGAASPASDFSSEMLARLTSRPDAAGRYRIQGEVARGGQGAILRVWDEDLRRHLAMKVTLGRVSKSDTPPTRLKAGSGTDVTTPPVDARTVGRFLEEAQVTGQLDHPGIVPVHELGLDSQGRVFFTMKLVKGEDLKAVFARVHAGEAGWTVTRALSLLLRVCEAMSYAHSKRVIHRDLKPSNIMVGRYGEVFVMDWGLARVLDRKDEKDVRIRPQHTPLTSELHSERRERTASDPESPLVTMDGDVVGTPAYMSPEQASGRLERMGPPSDVYALGAMLYHLITGRMPYVTPDARVNNYAILSRVQEGPPASVASLAPASPAELVAICEKAMSREPAARYADMSALAGDLRAYLERRVVAAYETGAVAELRKWVVRNKPLAAALAGLLVLALTAGCTFAWLSSELSMTNADLQHTNDALGTALTDAKAQRQLASDNAQQAQASASLAQQNAARAHDNAEHAAANAARAEAERANVLRLSAFQELDDLRKEADALWPATPDRLPDYDAWLRRAAALIAGLQPSGDGTDIGHRRQLALLRERALPRTDTEVEADRHSHPRFPELALLDTKIDWMRHVQAIRSGAAQPAPPEIGAGLADAPAEKLLNTAWELVDPDRHQFGREAEGLALARRAFERTASGQRAPYGNLLAWALLANGMDAEALAASSAALDAAQADARNEYRAQFEKLTNAVNAANSPDWITSVEAERVQVDAAVAEQRTWAFSNPDETWWHNQLTRLIDEIEAFADPSTGLVDGVSDAYGWGIRRRQQFAATIQELTIRGAAASRRWAEASASIADRSRCPAYAGLMLQPQLGLLPIGRDPHSGLWEFWHVESGLEPVRGTDGNLVLTEASGIVLVLIPGGSFWMGAQASDPTQHNYDPQAEGNEAPVHEVTLSPFFLSKYEMSQGQWAHFTGRNPSQYRPGMIAGPNTTTLLHPVEHMSWNECAKFLPRMGLAIPTEAQWERGARGGTTTPWWTGSERNSLAQPLAANLADQTAARANAAWSDIQDWPELDDGYIVHAPVNHYAPNPYGLYNVHGNVWEWCQDSFDSYEAEPQQDPVNENPGNPFRSFRGGSFDYAAASARSACRNQSSPDSALNIIGLRPARSITH